MQRSLTVSLTGSAFLSLIAAATVTAFVAVVLLWPRFAGRRPTQLAARAGLLVLVNGLVLLTAATQLNARYLFFADWNDLRGSFAGTSTVTSLSRGADAASTAGHTPAGAAAQAPSTLPALTPEQLRHDGVITYQVRGRRSGLTGTVMVQLPPGYAQPGETETRYPVLETFPGYPGAIGQWIETMRLGTALAAGVSAHEIRAALIVSPQVQIPDGVDTECVNGAKGRPQLETWLAQDVPDWVAHTFRVETQRSSWAAIGLSAGGWCAAMVAMLHPAQYDAAIVMGGYFHPDFGPFYLPYPDTRNALASRYNLVALAAHHPPPIAIWLETSHLDATSYSSSAAFLRATKRPTGVDAYVLQNAGHRIGVWQGLLPVALRWLGTDVSGFSAG